MTVTETEAETVAVAVAVAVAVTEAVCCVDCAQGFGDFKKY